MYLWRWDKTTPEYKVVKDKDVCGSAWAEDWDELLVFSGGSAKFNDIGLNSFPVGINLI